MTGQPGDSFVICSGSHREDIAGAPVGLTSTLAHRKEPVNVGRGQDAVSAPLSPGAVHRLPPLGAPATPPGHVLRLLGRPHLCWLTLHSFLA